MWGASRKVVRWERAVFGACWVGARVRKACCVWCLRQGTQCAVFGACWERQGSFSVWSLLCALLCGATNEPRWLQLSSLLRVLFGG